MTLGLFTAIPLLHGRDGIPIRASGLADLISHSDSVSESAGLAASAGDGAIGDSIGTIITLFITTADISRAAEPSTTAAISIAEAVAAAK